MRLPARRVGRRVVACIVVDKSAPRVKVPVTLPSGVSARSEFPLDGPEARDIAALKVEDWVVKIGEQALGIGNRSVPIDPFRGYLPSNFLGFKV